MADSIRIELAYVEGDRPIVKSRVLPGGATVEDALRALMPDWNAVAWLRGERKVGVFGHLVGLDQVLSDADRVELYEPLLNDPKTARRQRAKATLKNSGRA